LDGVYASKVTNEGSGGVADATLREFASGQKLLRGTLPNDPRVFMLTGFITRCQGEFEERVRGLERALELDPRILRTLQQIVLHYQSLRAMPSRPPCGITRWRSSRMTRTPK